MRKITLAILLSFAFFSHTASFAQVGIGTTAPQGALDITSTTTGFVPPRVALTALNSASPVVNPQSGNPPAGTMVYNTTSNGSLVPGYYFWTGSVWTNFASQSPAPQTYDITTGVAAAILSATAPTLTTLGNLRYYSFAKADQVFFTVEMPANWIPGNITPKVNWMPIGTGTGNVIWHLEYSWQNVGVAHGATATISKTTTISASSDLINTLTVFDPIDGSAKTANSILICRLYRDNTASDTFSGAVGGNSVTFTVTVN